MSNEITEIKLCVQRTEILLAQSLKRHDVTESAVEKQSERISNMEKKIWTISGGLVVIASCWDFIKHKLGN